MYANSSAGDRTHSHSPQDLVDSEGNSANALAADDSSTTSEDEGPWPIEYLRPRAVSICKGTAFSSPCTQSVAGTLPTELLLEIFKFLSCARDLHATLLTCKLWSACCVEMLWYKPILYTPPALLKLLSTLRKDNTAYSYPVFVRRFNLSYLADQIADSVLLQLQSCRRIERLTLVNCRRITDRGLCDILSRNNGLVALDVTNLELITDLSILVAASRNKQLQGLNLTGCLRITDDAVTNIAIHCEQLRRVSYP